MDFFAFFQAGNYVNLRLYNLFLEGRIVKKKLHFRQIYVFISSYV